MRKKHLWSTLLTFAAVVTTVIAFSSMTVLADGDNISLSIDDFSIEHSGYSFVDYQITNIEFEEYWDEYDTGRVYNPDQVYFKFFGDTLKDGSNSIDFEVTDNDYYHSQICSSGYGLNGVGQSCPLYLYVDPDAYRAAEPGRYTGKLKIVPQWYENYDYAYEGDPIYIDISMVIKEKAGESIEWYFDDSMKVLTIDGTGAMNDFDTAELAPWYGIKDEIDRVAVIGGVTYVGSNSFAGCSALKTVYLSKTVTSIASNAFAGCTGVNKVTICSNPGDLSWDLSGFGSSTTFKVPRRFLTAYQNKYSGKTFEEYILKENSSCGSNASWMIDGDNVLVFSGTGSITDYGSYDNTPWYDYRNSIDEIVICDGIESIPSYAFYQFTKLTSISIADSVTKIGKYAFSGCNKLGSITLPAGLSEIDYAAFELCNNLKTIVIPDGATTIGDRAFLNCTCIESVVIPESVTSIGNSAFSGCSNLVSVNIPSGIKRIENYTFAECASLTLIDIPAGVKEIGSYAFYECYKLEKADFPQGLEKLGYGVFDDCYSLKSISIPSAITELGYELFQNCDSLTEVTIPSTVAGIGTNTFYSCDNLKKVIIEEGVISIGQNAFLGCSKLETVSLPDSLWSIGGSAFSGCTSLTGVVIPEGMQSIGNYSFYECDSLTSITIPSSAEVSIYAFACCDGLKTVVFADGCTTIPEGIFQNCTSLESVTIPDSVTYIGYSAFYGCSALESITIPGSVTELGNLAFQYCDNLKHVTLEDGIKIIGSQTFYGCSALGTIIIPSTVNTIGSYAFSYCSSMTDVYSFADPVVLNWYSCSSCFKNEGSTKCHVLNYYLQDYKSYHGDLNAIYVGDLNSINMGAGTHLYGYSLSLDGSIGVNFYMTLDPNLREPGSNAYMLFTVNGYTQKVPVKDITPDDQGYYIFKCKVAAKEMADNINARLYVDDAIPTDAEYNFCVRQYASYILKRPALYSNETVNLVKAMLNYGAYSQLYFNHNTSNLANSILPYNEQTVEIIHEGMLRPYTGNVSVNGRLTFYSASLSTKSETVLNFYFSDYEGCDHLNFKLDDGTAEGKVLSQSFSGGLLKVTVPNIPAQCAGDDYKIDVYEGSVLIGSITFSPVNYCYNVIHREITPTRTEALKLEVSAYILFYQKAVDYINSL